MNIEPMRTISFDGETVYTVPCPVEATAEMTQPVGVDGDGKLFTAPGGGGGGTGDHSQLSNRDTADQHPVSAITGLQTALNGKQDTLTAGIGINIVNNVISATGGGGSSGVFNVEYNTTTFSAIKSASDSGNMCQMKVGVKIYRLAAINSAVAYFVWTAQNSNRMVVTCTSAGVWSDEVSQPLQMQSIADTGNYFTTDTVEGALQEIGAELSGINALIGSGVII